MQNDEFFQISDFWKVENDSHVMQVRKNFVNLVFFWKESTL